MDVSLFKLQKLVMDRERPGVLQFMGLQRVGHDCVMELNCTEVFIKRFHQHICDKVFIN